MQSKFEITNVVEINLSNRVQGIMPYIIDGDGTLLGLVFKNKRTLPKPTMIYWLTNEQAYDATRISMNTQAIVAYYQKQIQLTFELQQALTREIIK